MSRQTLRLKRNDLQPYLYARAVSATGSAISLVGATIVASMRNTALPADTATSLKINRQSTGVTTTAATTGLFQYNWQSGDTDSIGTFSFEFEITPSAGGKFTLPSKRGSEVYIVIDADEDNT